MRIRILGEVIVEIDGAEVALPRAKERGLLAVLALRSNQLLSVEQLVETLWGEEAPPTAVRSLRSHVSRLRSSIGEDALLTVGSAYALSIDDDAVDAHEFVRLIEGAKHLADPEARSALTQALALWRGRPFIELSGSQRAEAEATRLNELRMGAELALIDLRLAAGEHDSLIGALELLTAEDPGREDLWHRLILSLYRSQRRADALRAFQRARSVLQDQMGLDPGRELVELERQILAGSSVLEPHGSGLPKSRAGKLSVLPTSSRMSQRFVGRDAALEQLDRHWIEALDARTGLVVVRGDPGAGKTSLLAEFASTLEGDALVAYGVADHDLQVPFLAASDVVRSLLDQLPQEQRSAALSGSGYLLDEVFAVRGIATPERGELDVTSELDPARLLSATEKLLDQIGGEHSILVLIDDVQWIDRASAALVRRWVRRNDRRLLIVLSSRTQGIQEPAERLLTDLTVANDLTSITLGGLSVEEVTLLLADHPDLNARELTMRTGGNPFLLRQLATHDDPRSLPDGVTALIGARVRELPETTRRALDVAAVAGGTIDAVVLAPVLGESSDVVIGHLDPAVQAGILDEDPDEMGQYVFDHDLIAETLRANLSYNQATLLHRQIGAAIRSRLTGPSDVMVFAVASHLRTGGAPADEQVRSSLEAGRLARQSLAFEDAAEWLEPALAIVDADPSIEDASRRELLLETGRVRGLRHQPNGRRLLLRAAELCDGDDLVEVAIELTRFNHARVTSEADEKVIAVIERAIEELGSDQNAERALLTAALSAELLWVEGIEERRALADSALDIARRQNDPVLLGEVILRVQISASCPDNLARRLADAQEAVTALDRSDSPDEGDTTRQSQAMIAASAALASAKFEEGDIESASRVLGRARDLSPGVAHSALAWRLTSLEIAIAIFQARFADAETLLAQLEVESAATGSPQHMLNARGWSQIFLDRGDHEILASIIDEIASSDPGVPGWASGHAVVLCDLGRQLDAAPLFRETMSRVEAADRNLGWLTHRAADALVARDLQDRVAMEELRSLLAPYGGRLCLDIIASVGPVDLALGVLAGGLDEYQTALDHLDSAADLCARSAAPIWQARCEVELARVFASMGRLAEARAAAQRALDRARHAGGRHVALVAEKILDTQGHL